MPSLLLTPPAKKIIGEMTLPGSKSYMNRALLIASLAEGKSILRGASTGEDSEVMIKALRKLGIQITRTEEGIEVTGCGGKFPEFNGELDLRGAGTAMRFLTALCCLLPGGEIILTGIQRMRERPIGDLVEALRSMGADISYLQNPGCPPLRIRPNPENLRNSVKIKGEISSQFVSALLMIGPRISGGLEISLEGEQVSTSYIDMTLQIMDDFGVEVKNEEYEKYSFEIENLYQGRGCDIEGDASGASYFWGLAAISGGDVCVRGINQNSLQGDAQFPELLEKMGCQVVYEKDSIRVIGGKELHGITADMSSMPDVAQTLAVIASMAKGTTVITGLSTLHHKETDRLVALHAELSRVGIENSITEDSITIIGGKPHAARIETYDDQRMAMAFSLLGAVIEGVEINHPEVVEKTFPSFWEEMETMGIEVKSSSSL